MTLHPLSCEEMVQRGAIDNMFRIIQKCQQSRVNDVIQVLLKALRNLSRWSKDLQCRLQLALDIRNTTPLKGVSRDPAQYFSTAMQGGGANGTAYQTSLYWEKHFWETHVDFIVKHSLGCENEDLLVEWIGILSNLTADDLPGGVQWHDILEGNQSPMLQCFENLLVCRYDLKLELIIWLGELSSQSRECSCWIATNNLVDVLHNAFGQCSTEIGQHTEMRLQIIQTYIRFLPYEETRFQVLGGDNVVENILLCLQEERSLRTVAERCLLFIEDLDRYEDGFGETGEYIRRVRYEELIMGSELGLELGK